MMDRSRPCPRRILSCSATAIAIVAAALGGPASAQSRSGSRSSDAVLHEVGLARLFERLSIDERPTGVGVAVAQVEAGGDDYAPDLAAAALRGKNYRLMSGPSGSVRHASSVARAFYGVGRSLAPGIRDVYLYDAAGWAAEDFLRATSGPGAPALDPPDGLKIVNNSWVGAFGNELLDGMLLRRADAVVLRDDLLMVNGVNNGAPNRPLLSHMFNGIAVGRSDGLHQPLPTLTGHDGPGRMKPEIVAPGPYTSFAAPVVSAAAALLVETARMDPVLAAHPDSERSDVLKAILLAGAHHREGWSNFPETAGPMRGVTTTPLDPVVGVDLLDVDESHRILTSGPIAGSFEIRRGRRVPGAGWSRELLWPGESVFYRVRVDRVLDDVRVVATWHRRVADDLSWWSMADVDLYLNRVDRRGRLEPLVGADGLDAFAGGNVTSESPIDNVEHLHVTGLAPGEYVIEVRRQIDDGFDGPWPVAIAWTLPPDAAASIADLSGDGRVDSIDLVDIISAWGACRDCPADITGDGRVDVEDMVIVLRGTK